MKVWVFIADNAGDSDITVQVCFTESRAEAALTAYCQSAWDRYPPAYLRGQRPTDFASAWRFAEEALSGDLITLSIGHHEVQS